MRKLIAAINMTLDGYCDHTAVVPDEEVHNHYTELLQQGGAILYGRITFQLMEFWRPFVTKPSGEKSMDDFAVAIDAIPKIVFSRTLKHVEWESARLADRSLEEEVTALKQESGKDIFVGSPSLIVALTQLGMIDEYQICVHPVIAGGGLPLFHQLNQRVMLTHVNTKNFKGGATLLYYEPFKENET